MTNDEAIEILKYIKARKADPDNNEKEALDLAIKVLSEPKITVFTENQTIRWTDKVFLKDNVNIVDFEGRVIGHINFDEG